MKLTECTMHHTSLTKGYVSRKTGSHPFVPYKGRFGEGFTRLSPNWKSTQYSFITYYIKTLDTNHNLNEEI